MVAEDNKTIHRRLIEALFNQKNLEVLDELIAPTFVGHALPPGFAPGREGLRQFVGGMHAAFPDLYVTVDHLIAEGDKVVVGVTVRGTNRGSFFGLPPTAKQATWAEMHICRYADGQWVEHWGIVDQLGLLQQLGAVPTQAGS